MNAGFRAQPAECIVARELDGGAFDAGDLTRRTLEETGFYFLCEERVEGGNAIARAPGGRWSSALWTGLMISALSIGSISYGAWQKWWLAAIWIAVAVGVAVTRRIQAEPPDECGRPAPRGQT